MTSPQAIFCVYTTNVTSGAKSIDQVINAMALVPVDNDYLNDVWGLWVYSDQTVQVGSTAVVQRTIELAMVPPIAAAATASLWPGDVGSPLRKINVTAIGNGYVLPPIVSISDPTGSGANVTALMGVSQVLVTNGGGSGYTAPKASFVGGLAINNPIGLSVPATATVSLSGSSISGVTVTGVGGPYAQLPDLVITDTTGSGATFQVKLGVNGYFINNPGQAYTAPVVTVTPYYKASVPDSADQTAPVAAFMQQKLQKALKMPIIALKPTLGPFL